MAAIGKPIEHGAGQPFVFQHLCPLFERQIRGDDDTGPLVGLADSPDFRETKKK